MRLAPLFAVLVVGAARADDWPQWMGPTRDAVWAETGITRALPKGDPKKGNRIPPLWSAPVSSGYSGPAVAGGKVYLTDRVLAKNAHNPADPFDTKTVVKSDERVLCLDAKTGQQLWKHVYKCDLNSCSSRLCNFCFVHHAVLCLRGNSTL